MLDNHRNERSAAAAAQGHEEQARGGASRVLPEAQLPRQETNRVAGTQEVALGAEDERDRALEDERVVLRGLVPVGVLPASPSRRQMDQHGLQARPRACGLDLGARPVATKAIAALGADDGA